VPCHGGMGSTLVPGSGIKVHYNRHRVTLSERLGETICGSRLILMCLMSSEGNSAGGNRGDILSKKGICEVRGVLAEYCATPTVGIWVPNRWSPDTLFWEGRGTKPRCWWGGGACRILDHSLAHYSVTHFGMEF